MTWILKKRTWKLLLPVFLLLGFVNIVKADDNGPKEPFIKVTGEGKVAAIPDQAEMDFEVSEEGNDLDELTAKVSERMKDVFKVIKSFNISDKDFKTVRYDIQPKYKYNNGENQRNGFIVSNQIHLVLKKIEDAGRIMDEATKAGISQVDGPVFGFSDPSKLQMEALKDAVDDAHDKAETLAQASGADLGKVFSINQVTATRPGRIMGNLGEMKAAASVSVPIAAGEDEVTAQVEVVYLLK